jgi:hypothetical protein
VKIVNELAVATVVFFTSNGDKEPLLKKNNLPTAVCHSSRYFYLTSSYAEHRYTVIDRGYTVIDR